MVNKNSLYKTLTDMYPNAYVVCIKKGKNRCQIAISFSDF